MATLLRLRDGSQIEISKDFLSSLLNDDLKEWGDAIELGKSLTTAFPTLLIGHLILCRGYRHIGQLDVAREELRTCLELSAAPGFFELDHLQDVEIEARLLGRDAEAS